MKVDNDTKNSPIDVTHVDSKSAKKNTIAPRNLEIAFENMFSFLPPGGSFMFRREGRYDQIDFRNAIYTCERTRNWLD